MKGKLTTKIQVSGMTCGSCVAHVENSSRTVPGVNTVEVELRSETAAVEGDADVGARIAAIEGEGYGPAVVSA